MERDQKLWDELSREEKAQEKAEFIKSWVLETGCTPSEARGQWEQYLNQEGWTGRDERIQMKRDRLYEDALNSVSERNRKDREA